MADRWVINASPVILLGKAGVINLLPLLCDELVVTPGVVAEVQQGRMADIGRAWLAGEGGKFVRSAPALHAALTARSGGALEAEVISRTLAHPGFVAVPNDRAARRMAAQQGVPVVGSLRVIVKAKKLGLLASARPTQEKLRGSGTYVSDDLIDRAIALAGET